ncbi:MAG: DUF1569 domain-containing protein [Bacteroidia bacterium]|nr:DUF1569 domain-containing protein [Bacteroidia bacterium]
MKNNLFESATQKSILDRIQKLTPESKPLWGVMTVNQVVCHLADPLRDVLNLRSTRPVVPGFLRPLMRLIVLTEKPWKPGTPTLKPYKQGPGGKGTPPTTFEADKSALIQLVREFCSKDATFRFNPHPGLGRLSREKMGFFIWKHCDHHLRQFGV